MTRSVLTALLAAAVFGAPALADTADKRIALSNNYAGNSWRQAMLKSWEKVTAPAVADGTVAAADAFTTAENQVTEQAAQIQNLILQGYDAIVLNAASPEGLNGAVKEACDAGIIVVSFDGIVTEPCAWRIAVDFKQMGKDEVLYLAKKMPNGGNLLEIRGLAGVFVDDEISKGIHEGVAENPQFKIVGSVHGDWAQDVAQKAVVSTLAFWVAQQILEGKDVPKDLTVPFLRIDQDDLEGNLETTEAGGVANVEYSLRDAQQVIAGGGGA
jgi:ribose transport system substrate-binding protein